MRKIQGFTLIEVMVTVAIVAILAAVGIPSLKSFMENNQIRAEAQRLGGVLSLARNEAVSNNQNIIVYGTESGNSLSIDVYIDGNGDATVVYDAGVNDVYIERSPGATTSLDYGFNTVVSGDSAVRFDNQGRLNETGFAIITICNLAHTRGRMVQVNRVGRVSISGLTDPTAGCL